MLFARADMKITIGNDEALTILQHGFLLNLMNRAGISMRERMTLHQNLSEASSVEDLAERLGVSPGYLLELAQKHQKGNESFLDL